MSSVHILGRLLAKISVFDVHIHFNYLNSKKKIYHWNSNRQQDRIAHLLFKYFYLGPVQSSRAQIFGSFWAKISAFDEKYHFDYERIHKNHISLEFESWTGENDTLDLRVFSFKVKSDNRFWILSLFFVQKLVFMM